MPTSISFEKQAQLAFSLAKSAHAGMFDKKGAPAIKDIKVVANKFKSDPELFSIAIMKDVVAKTHLLITDIEGMGFSTRILNGIRSLSSRNDRQTYYDYVIALSKNSDAALVKYEELLLVMKQIKSKKLHEEKYEADRYEWAIDYLLSIIDDEKKHSNGNQPMFA